LKKLLIAALLIGLGIYGYIQQHPNPTPRFTEERSVGDQLINDAFRNRQDDLQIGGTGKVIHILPDDKKGSRHQKFIIKLSSGQTLLISHNIDLAPRINSLGEGDKVEFYGEYEWNPKGGIVDWTHHDPKGRHEDGWLKHDGRTYK
jgi:hypothetical protein